MADAEGKRVSQEMADPLDTDDSAAPPVWVARESREQLARPFTALPGASRSSQAWLGSTVMCLYNHSGPARSVSAVAKVAPRVKPSNDSPSCEDAGSAVAPDCGQAVSCEWQICCDQGEEGKLKGDQWRAKCKQEVQGPWCPGGGRAECAPVLQQEEEEKLSWW